MQTLSRPPAKPAAPRRRAPSAVPPVLRLIGRTPLVALHFRPENLTIHAKVEFTNPSGSIKDRLALHLLTDARQKGLLRPDSVILECSSGNTGISLAMVGAALGHKVKILMSDSASVERRHLITHFGAELHLFKTTRGYVTGIELAEQMAAEDPRYFLTRQFENPLNAEDHELHTGMEILTQTRGKVDAFVSGYGTGGTLHGVSLALRAANPNVQIVAMEPAEAAMLSGETPCCHSIEGVAGGFVPPLLREVKIDARERIRSEDAIVMARRLSREFGLCVGPSSGANVVAALRTAAQLPRSAKVVTILCDRADRYCSTRLFNQPAANV